jgi:tripeptide aminopeptidase
MKIVKNKFLKYVKFDTQSNEKSDTLPSSINQFELAKELKNELETLELMHIKLTDKCYLYATLPANSDIKVPAIGFIAHFDTSPDFPGNHVNPQIINPYEGDDIILNESEKLIMSPTDFPDLKKYIGQEIITTDGKSLLGADDKAGIAEIMTAVEYLVEHPEIKHGQVNIAFTPDEEIGKGADFFDFKIFNADFAFTIDGGELGELQYENFNAANFKVLIKGRNIHPGSAKNRMINSINIAHEFHSMLPQDKRPEHTDGYEGFFHLSNIFGNEEETKMTYIIRDYDIEKFEEMKRFVLTLSGSINDRYNKEIISIEMKDTYYNMYEKIKPQMHIIEIAKEAMNEAGVEPIIRPIRGGTDGAKLSYIFTGGHHYHGKFEFIPVKSMEKAAEVIVNIIRHVHNTKN